jgi:hypothetical protein
VRTASLLLLLLLAGGCAAGPASLPGPALAPDEERADVSYRLECDRISGEQVCVMIGNPLLPLTPRYPMLSLGAMKVGGGGSDAPRYFLRAVYVNMGTWLHIPDGASLELGIDGEILEMRGAGSAQARTKGEAGKVFEVALYPISPEVITKIAAARAVTVRLRGDFTLEKRLAPANRVYFHVFATKNIDGVSK